MVSHPLHTRAVPEDLLKQIKEEERKARRGKLKIFFGAYAGVGKTYAMLSAAHQQKQEGVDVVAGIVETHRRPETEKLLEGLPSIASIESEYRGVTLREFNLDAALQRKPELLLVDELAHTNAPGSRHPKRWNDIDELLDAGINVYTTLNVQHIESLSDLVAGSTGVTVKETIPDSVFDAADDIVLVDINVDELLKRLREGKVYVAERARTQAADNFFRKGNLTALRELALRRAAERVDAQRDEYDFHEGLRERAPIADKIMVCIGPDPLSAKLVRTAKRVAASFKAPWVAVHVENARRKKLNERDQQALQAVFRLVERLGGKVVTLQADSVADEIIAYSQSHNATKIIVGRPIKSKLRLLFESSLSDTIIHKSGSIDVYIVTGEPGARYHSVFGRSMTQKTEPGLYVWSFFAVIFATAIGLVARDLISPADQALVYLTGVVIVAVRYGLGPALLYAFLSATSLDFFFIDPLYSFNIYDRSYWTTLTVMLLTGFVIADRTSRLRHQTIMARKRELNTQTLYGLTKELAAAQGERHIATTVARHIVAALDVGVTVWLPRANGELALIVGELPAESMSKENGALQWCFDNAKPAGRGTNTMPSASGFYLPLVSAQGTIGVLGIVLESPDSVLSTEETGLLETIASLLVASLERVKATELAERSMVEAESERLRNTLLSSVSHDLRTPLASITGASSSIAMDVEKLPQATIRDLATSIHKEATRLSRLVTNLLDITTLEAGRVRLNRQPYFIQEIIGAALTHCEHALIGRSIGTKAAENLPMAMADGTLIEQVLQNLIENAAHHTSQGAAITIEAQLKNGKIIVSVADDGTGIPKGEEEKIFDKFYTIKQSGSHKGTGLGLAICASIIKAHGEHIWAENRTTGGALFGFTVPVADASKQDMPHDDA